MTKRYRPHRNQVWRDPAPHVQGTCDTLYQRILAQAQRSGSQRLIEQVKTELQNASRSDVAGVLSLFDQIADHEVDPDSVELRTIIEAKRQERCAEQQSYLSPIPPNEVIETVKTLDSLDSFDSWTERFLPTWQAGPNDYDRYSQGLSKKQIKKPETALQIAFIRWLESQHPDIFMFTFASAGGIRSTARAGAEMSHMGYKRGTPDIFIMLPRQGFHALIIEIKTKRGRATKEQKEVLQQLSQQGYKSVVCKGWDDLIGTVRKYFAV